MNSSNLANPQEVFTITPSDTVNLTKRARDVYVGGAGNLSVRCDHDGVITTATFSNHPGGAWLGVEVVRVNAAGTTATALVGVV